MVNALISSVLYSIHRYFIFHLLLKYFRKFVFSCNNYFYRKDNLNSQKLAVLWRIHPCTTVLVYVAEIFYLKMTDWGVFCLTFRTFLHCICTQSKGRRRHHNHTLCQIQYQLVSSSLNGVNLMWPCHQTQSWERLSFRLAMYVGVCLTHNTNQIFAFVKHVKMYIFILLNCKPWKTQQIPLELITFHISHFNDWKKMGLILLCSEEEISS